jgi:NCS1 family nucleobase:cation symporter-1
MTHHAADVPPEVARSPHFNADLAPVPPERRTWTTYNFATLWIGMSVCIPTYMLGASLIDGGMNWWQALLTILLGNVIVLVPIILNAHSGAKYGIPFPVLARSSFGVRGSNVVALMRAVVACGWFGIQTWLGGQAIHTLIGVAWPVWKDLAFAPWVSFAVFWLVNVYFIVRGTESIRFLEAWGAPFLIVVGLVLLVWAVREAGGWGPIFTRPARFATTREFLAFFIPSLTAMVGYWATLALNIPDFTRYARSQRDQVLGQALGLPPTMGLYAFIGIAVTSATIAVYGQALWNPVDLLGRFTSPLVIALSVFALAIATLTTNIAANVVSPANDFSNLAPRLISYRTGGLITALVGIAIMPWKLLSSSQVYIFDWLIGYSGFLGPIAGVLIADYFVVRRRNVDTWALYVRGGAYEFSGGYNLRALAALGAGCAIAFLGLVYEPLHELFHYAWFVGFAVAFVAHIAWAERGPAPTREWEPAS